MVMLDGQFLESIKPVDQAVWNKLSQGRSTFRPLVNESATESN